MATAERKSVKNGMPQAEIDMTSRNPDKTTQELVEEIDRLRKAMTETFMKELSFTSDSVVELSRQLDLKINKYMRRASYHRQ